MADTLDGEDALGRVRDALFDAGRAAHRLAEAVEAMEHLYAQEYPGLRENFPQGIPTSYFYASSRMQTGVELHEEGTDRVPERERPVRRRAIDATLALRAAVDSAIAAVSKIGVYMDSDAESVDRRWTTRTIGHLRELRGAILRGHPPDFFPSALPMIQSGVPNELRETAQNVGARMEELKSAILAGVQPRAPAVSVPLDLLDRLQRAAAAVDPHAIDRAAEKTAQVFGAGDDGDTKPPAPPGGVALTVDHESILAVLGKTPTKCKTVIDVASAGPLRNRETVGRLLRELESRGMVVRPFGKQKGYALTDTGRKRLPGAKPT